MYMVRIVWKCARGKVPECLEVVKEVRASWARDGNTTGKIYADYTDRMDTIAFEIEVESLDDYFNNQRTNYNKLSPETEESVRRFNSNSVEGNRQIWEVIPWTNRDRQWGRDGADALPAGNISDVAWPGCICTGARWEIAAMKSHRFHIIERSGP